jgi:hypothetical protein
MKKIVSVLLLAIMLLTASFPSFAATQSVVTIPASQIIHTSKPVAEASNQPRLLTATSNVAELTIYATNDGSSSSSTSGHGWVTIKNIGTANITIGQLSAIKPNLLISVGTWGNETEHNGLWYNLECFYNKQLAYKTVSLSMQLTAAQLSTVNSIIVNNDAWAPLNNCSSFATKLWNSVSSTSLSAGIPNTPTALIASIKSKAGYKTNSAFGWDYIVYYAQGASSAPKPSVKHVQ